MITRPTIISMNTSVRDAATVMTSGRFRHLPVVGDDNGLVGIVDVTDVCRALIGLRRGAIKTGKGIPHVHD